MGLFLTGSGLALLLFFLGCAAPHEQLRLHGSPCHLLQGFESTGSWTMLATVCVQSRDTSPAWFVLFGMLPTSSSSVRSVCAPLQKVSGCCRQRRWASGWAGDKQAPCSLWLQWREHADVLMALITGSLIPLAGGPALHWQHREVRSREDAQMPRS